VAYFNLGAVYHKLGDNQSAATCYRQALALRPNYAEAQQALAAVEAAAIPLAGPTGPQATYGAPVAPAAPQPAPAAPAPQAQAPWAAPPGAQMGAPGWAMPAAARPRKAARRGRLAAALLLVVLGGGGGLAFWYFGLGGSPQGGAKATLEAFLKATKKEDFYAVEELVASADAAAVKRFGTRVAITEMPEVRNILEVAKMLDGVEERSSYTIGKIEVDGEKATATVKLVGWRARDSRQGRW
jgi:hypothetical protein